MEQFYNSHRKTLFRLISLLESDSTIYDVLNQYNTFNLPKLWKTLKVASADEQNMICV